MSDAVDLRVARLMRRAERERTARLLAEEIAERATRSALHDPLTGVANRSLFMDRLALALRQSGRSDRSVAVFFLDLDRFKFVNDSLGHQAGDRLLIEVARRLRGAVRPGDTVARMGGDEFTILCTDCDDAGAAIEIAERLSRAFNDPVEVDGARLHAAGSIGVVLASAHDRPADVLRDADAAMYAAKASRARYAMFDETMRSSAAERLAIEDELRRAIAVSELETSYRPLVDVMTGAIVAVEALARWRHRERGLLLPSDNVAIGEDTGLISSLGRRILQRACVGAQRWSAAHGQWHETWVRLSEVELSQPDIVEIVAEALGGAGMPPAALCLLITANPLITHPGRRLERLEALKELGVRLALDHFGAGQSSLACVKRLPIDALRIDRFFVAGLATDRADGAIVEAIVAMAHALEVGVVADGVESKEQWNELRRLGCDRAQGQLFGRPLSAAAIGKLLSDSAGTHGGVTDAAPAAFGAAVGEAVPAGTTSGGRARR